MSVADQDEPALKREQLEQVQTEIHAKLETSRMEWIGAIRDGHFIQPGVYCFHG